MPPRPGRTTPTCLRDAPSAGRAPAVSAIFVAQPGRSQLGAAVRSLVRQDYRPLELVVFGNGGHVDPPPTADPAIPVRVGSAKSNLGVAGGRNAAARLAQGELLLFVDDDALLHPGAVGSAVRALGPAVDGVGAVAFRILDPVSRTPALWYYPYDPALWSERPFEASSIVGCGALVRRKCFERLGGFWDGYFREMEEIDLSWRLIDAGWTIRYEPHAVVDHAERVVRHLRYSVASNLLLVWRLLPYSLALRQTVLKLALFVVRALRHREVGELVRGIRDTLRAAPRAARERSPLGPATVSYLRRVHAPQGFGKRLQWSLRPLAPPPPAEGQPAIER